jgi:hypothetical protein
LQVALSSKHASYSFFVVVYSRAEKDFRQLMRMELDPDVLLSFDRKGTKGTGVTKAEFVVGMLV